MAERGQGSRRGIVQQSCSRSINNCSVETLVGHRVVDKRYYGTIVAMPFIEALQQCRGARRG